MLDDDRALGISGRTISRGWHAACLLSREWLDQVDEVIVTLSEEHSARIQEINAMLKGLPLKVTIASGWTLLRPL